MIRTRNFAAALAIAFCAPTVSSQFCTPDDGMTGPCCSTVTGAFPAFPTMTLPGLGASLFNCDVNCVWPVTTTVSPIPITCDYYLFVVGFASTDPTIVSVPPATFISKYARTWSETGPLGPMQVWRFLINGEVTYAPSSPTMPTPTPCHVPFSAFPPYFLPPHFQGHLDYARNCATGVWEVALAVTHLCPFEAHSPFSAHPLTIPSGVLPRTYHFVAPDNFVFGPGPSPEGTVVGDAQRSSLLVAGAPYECLAEHPIVTGAVATSYCDCICSSAAGPPTYHHQTLTATVANCGVTELVASVPIPGVLPTGLRTHMFGSWTAAVGAQIYPGAKHVGHYMGVLSQVDVCAGVSAPLGPFHLVTGVGTTGGYPQTISSTIPPTTVAMDLTNMLLFPTLTPGIAGLFVSDRLWSFNLTPP